jgi:hypothetical protein
MEVQEYTDSLAVLSGDEELKLNIGLDGESIILLVAALLIVFFTSFVFVKLAK